MRVRSQPRQKLSLSTSYTQAHTDTGTETGTDEDTETSTDTQTHLAVHGRGAGIQPSLQLVLEHHWVLLLRLLLVGGAGVLVDSSLARTKLAAAFATLHDGC